MDKTQAKCEDCLYWEEFNDQYMRRGFCHRYPRERMVDTAFNYWCGELKARSATE